MPRDDETPICGTSKIPCYDQAEDDLLQEQYVDGITANDKLSLNECNCLPSCTSIRYEAEITQAPYDYIRASNAFRNTDELPGLKIFFSIKID